MNPQMFAGMQSQFPPGAAPNQMMPGHAQQVPGQGAQQLRRPNDMNKFREYYTTVQNELNDKERQLQSIVGYSKGMMPQNMTDEMRTIQKEIEQKQEVLNKVKMSLGAGLHQQQQAARAQQVPGMMPGAPQGMMANGCVALTSSESHSLLTIIPVKSILPMGWYKDGQIMACNMVPPPRS